MRVALSRGRHWGPHLYAMALFAAYAAIILVHPTPPPLGDFADWVYQGALLARHLHGLPDTAHTLKHYPVPNSTATVLLGLLAFVMPWTLAAKIFLLLELVVAWFAIRTLALSANTGSWIWYVAPSGFFLNINFWFGLIAFQLGMALLFFFLAANLNRKHHQGYELRNAILLILLFFTHMVPFTFACLVLVCQAALARCAKLLIAILPSAVLLVWYGWARWQSGNPDAQAVQRLPFHSIGFYAAYKINTILKSFGFVNPGDSYSHSLALALLGPSGFAILFAVNLLACGAVLWLVAAALRRTWSRTRQLDVNAGGYGFADAIWASIILCLPVYLLLPRATLGLSDPGSRVLQVVFYVALFLCIAHNRITQLLSAASIAMALTGLFLFVRVGYTTTPVAGMPTAPGTASRLAIVPYAAVAGYYVSLNNGDYQTGVFTTGLFTNERPH